MKLTPKALWLVVALTACASAIAEPATSTTPDTIHVSTEIPTSNTSAPSLGASTTSTTELVSTTTTETPTTTSTVTPVRSTAPHATAPRRPVAVKTNASDDARCAEMEKFMRAVGLPERFGGYGRHQRWTASDGIGWGESKCHNDVGNSCCVGWWELNVAVFLRDAKAGPRFRNECGIYSKYDAMGTSTTAKWKQACGAAVIYSIAGIGAWR